MVGRDSVKSQIGVFNRIETHVVNLGMNFPIGVVINAVLLVGAS